MTEICEATSTNDVLAALNWTAAAAHSAEAAEMAKLDVQGSSDMGAGTPYAT